MTDKDLKIVQQAIAILLVEFWQIAARELSRKDDMPKHTSTDASNALSGKEVEELAIGLIDVFKINDDLEKIKEIVASLPWYESHMVMLYLEVGNYRAMETKTQIPFISCYKTVKKAIKLIKDRL